MRKEVRTPKTSFTRQELFLLVEKILDSVARDCCPNCETLISWRDCYTEDDIKRKIEELGIEFKEVK